MLGLRDPPGITERQRFGRAGVHEDAEARLGLDPEAAARPLPTICKRPAGGVAAQFETTSAEHAASSAGPAARSAGIAAASGSSVCFPSLARARVFAVIARKMSTRRTGLAVSARGRLSGGIADLYVGVWTFSDEAFILLLS